MTVERLCQIQGVVEGALDQPLHARERFLRDACHADPELLRSVGAELETRGHPEAWIARELANIWPRMCSFSVVESPRPHLEGRRIGAFQILRRLGEGRMFTAYLGVSVDRDVRRFVTIKMLRQEAVSPGMALDFRDYVKALESLEHDGIARVLDAGTTTEWTLRLTCCPEHPGLASDQPSPFLVTEYVEGVPIDVYWWRTWSELPARLRLFDDVCTAVQHAHERGIVHGNLKPANVLVAPDGTVKVLDFGLADLSPPKWAWVDMRGGEYASPERRTGPATPSADVYGLGVLFYRLVTGWPPFPARERVVRPSLAAARRQPAGRDGSPLKLPPEAQTVLDVALVRSLESSTERRYESVGALAAEVRRCLSSVEIGGDTRTAAQTLRPGTLDWRRWVRRH